MKVTFIHECESTRSTCSLLQRQPQYNMCNISKCFIPFSYLFQPETRLNRLTYHSVTEVQTLYLRGDSNFQEQWSLHRVYPNTRIELIDIVQYTKRTRLKRQSSSYANYNMYESVNVILSILNTILLVSFSLQNGQLIW